MAIQMEKKNNLKKKFFIAVAKIYILALYRQGP